MTKSSLKEKEIQVQTVFRNPSAAFLYELALKEDYQGKMSSIASSGALIAYSGAKTGRSPADKRIVEEAASKDNIDWGKVNIPLPEASFKLNKEIALKYLNGCEQLFQIDGYIGWNPKSRIKGRIICARPYHALFMNNMMIRPTEAELATFGNPDWIIYNAGQQAASTSVPGVTSETSVCLDFASKEGVILGSEYAGCMKKAFFTVMNYELPLKGILPMHCSANEAPDGSTALFFGLSGTGKTTLSADPARQLIGDDEHGWDADGIFNFEGGCYAKTVKLSASNEPDIWKAIRFGTVLENVVYHPDSHQVDFNDISITENTRASYPIEFIENAKIPCLGTHPKNVIFLTCDAYGVLPPVSKLSPAQAMYHFISGYTAKVAGTEMGITEPEATFSACFGAAFMVWHPMKYAELLKQKLLDQQATVWLVNTGWTGGNYGVGKRISLKDTRSIVTAILNGSLEKVSFSNDPVFGLASPMSCAGVDSKLLSPEACWSDKAAFKKYQKELAEAFLANFEQYAAQVSGEVLAVAPKI